MGDSSSITIRDADKLKGQHNYYVWALKLKAILRGENLQAISETVQNPLVYRTTIDGEAMTEVQLRKKNAIATRIHTLAVNNDLVDMVTAHVDPTLASLGSPEGSIFGW